MAALVFDHPALNARLAPGLPPVEGVTGAASILLKTWGIRSRTRADLARMDPLRYPDLGLTTAEVLHEVAKPFWRA